MLASIHLDRTTQGWAPNGHGLNMACLVACNLYIRVYLYMYIAFIKHELYELHSVHWSITQSSLYWLSHGSPARPKQLLNQRPTGLPVGPTFFGYSNISSQSVQAPFEDVL